MGIRHLLWSLFLVLVSCNTAPSLSDQLQGHWTATGMKVLIHSVHGTEGEDSVVANVDNWEQVIGLKPTQTFIFGDSFRYEYRDLAGKMFRETSGTWEVKGDTVLFWEKETSFPYKLNVNGDIMILSCMLDWDGDKEKDDEYLGQMRRIQ